MTSDYGETMTSDYGETEISDYRETMYSDYGETMNSDYGESENIRMPTSCLFSGIFHSRGFSFEGNIKR